MQLNRSIPNLLIWYTETENTNLKFFGQILLMRILKTNISHSNILTNSHKILQISTDWLGFADKVALATAHFMFFNLQTPPPGPTSISNMTLEFPTTAYLQLRAIVEWGDKGEEVDT